MGEIRDITVHLQHPGNAGPTDDEIAEAMMAEFGEGPIHLDAGYSPTPQQEREDRIVANLERARDYGMGAGMMTAVLSVIAYGLERPDVGGAMIAAGVGSFVFGVIAAYTKEGYELHTIQRYLDAR